MDCTVIHSMVHLPLVHLSHVYCGVIAQKIFTILVEVLAKFYAKHTMLLDSFLLSVQLILFSLLPFLLHLCFLDGTLCSAFLKMVLGHHTLMKLPNLTLVAVS